MKALTIWQPWASLIIAGAKPVEWRGWACPRWIVGQRIAIHAGARPAKPDEIADIIARIDDAETSLVPDLARPLLTGVHARSWPLSSVLGTAILGPPVPAIDRLLSTAEEARLFAALRPDFHGFVRFAVISGQRLSNVLRLRWSQIDWEHRVIRLRLKSRRPGGEPHLVPISPALAAILSAERGRHPEFVFTYVPQRARSERGRQAERTAGARQPFTRAGWRKAWAQALKAAGIADLRFHDLRHTALTRVYRATGNLRATQKLAGHKSIATTLRYENSGLDDVRDALEAAEGGGVNVRATGVTDS